MKRVMCQIDIDFKKLLIDLQSDIMKIKQKRVSETEITKLIAHSKTITDLRKEILKLKRENNDLKMDRRGWL